MSRLDDTKESGRELFKGQAGQFHWKSSVIGWELEWKRKKCILLICWPLQRMASHTIRVTGTILIVLHLKKKYFKSVDITLTMFH